MEAVASRGPDAGAMLRRIEPLVGPVAAVVLGMSAAFFCFALPLRIVAPAVQGLGLSPVPAIARVGLPLVVALIVGAATWWGFRFLDRRPAPRARPATLAIDAAPVLRRADAHPDAPARRPIFAGSDLGAPLHLSGPLSEEREAEGSVPAVDDVDQEGMAPATRTVPEPARADTSHDDILELTVMAPDDVDASPAAASPSPVRERTAGAPERTGGGMPKAVEPEGAFLAVDAAPSGHAALPVVETAAAPLGGMMGQLEHALARKALALGAKDSNVTPLKRELRPVSGSLLEVFERLQRRTTERH